MWYLVNLPGNKLNVAVRTEKNSIAADCLNKVCHDLGIICETDYFGLLYATSPHDHHHHSHQQYSHIKQWINLRNPLDKRHKGESPTLLELRVKFWVPAHLILQENVREIFYMQARQMLIDNEIHPSDWRQAARMTALVAQAQGIKFIPDLLTEGGQKIIAEFAEVVRQKVKRVKDKPSDNATKRNSFDEMKVDSDKEYLHSHDNRLLLEKFILENYLEHMTFPCSDNDDDENDDDAIADDGDSSDSDNNKKTENEEQQLSDFLLNIAREHQKIHTMTQVSAKYWLLEEFSTLKRFGEETFEGTLISESESKVTQHRNETIRIAVNSQGLSVRILGTHRRFSIPFSAVESAKSLRRCFHLCYLNENYTDSSMIIKFSSHRIAGTLYRALTEKHSFYSCETVHKNVETQFIRDLKGTIVSMFNEDTELGKKYVFDIRLTFRELYDNSRRVLHAKGIDVSKRPSVPEEAAATSAEMDSNKRIDVTCTICMDHKIDTLFLPCAHLSCCRNCADKCETCPLCRKSIVSTSLVYFT